jgi:hypothetical protein
MLTVVAMVECPRMRLTTYMGVPFASMTLRTAVRSVRGMPGSPERHRWVQWRSDLGRKDKIGVLPQRAIARLLWSWLACWSRRAWATVAGMVTLRRDFGVLGPADQSRASLEAVVPRPKKPSRIRREACGRTYSLNMPPFIWTRAGHVDIDGVVLLEEPFLVLCVHDTPCARARLYRCLGGHHRE